MPKPNRIEAGQVYGRLTVSRVLPPNPKRRIECLCACGTTISVAANNLANGHTQSCGCILRAVRPSLNRSHGHAADGRLTLSYRSWKAMKQRCLDPGQDNFRHYGGRGITVCPQWRNDFGAFLRDVGPRPSAGHSLERIDNDGNYEPDNVRWALHRDQCQNRRNNRFITIDGETLPAKEWMRRLGVARTTFYRRLRNGMTANQALTA